MGDVKSSIIWYKRNIVDNLKVKYTNKVLVSDINVEDINYMQCPEWHKTGEVKVLRGNTKFIKGNWCDIDNKTKMFWSSKYEYNNYEKRFFIPLANFYFFNALTDRFIEGRAWSETKWCQWLFDQINSEPVYRYENKSVIKIRLQLIDDMYFDMKSNGYKPKQSNKFYERPKEYDYPIVNIGNNGKIAIEDGRHRICVAKVAGIKKIPVRIGVVNDVDSRSVLKRFSSK